MFDIGFWELTLIGLLALIVLGPKRLPEAAAAAGRWIGRMRQFVANVKQDLDRELHGQDLAEFRRLKEELDAARQTLASSSRDLLEGLPQEAQRVPDYLVESQPDLPPAKKPRKRAARKKRSGGGKTAAAKAAKKKAAPKKAAGTAKSAKSAKGTKGVRPVVKKKAAKKTAAGKTARKAPRKAASARAGATGARKATRKTAAGARRAGAPDGAEGR